jgi:hypothetical protein
MQVIVHARKVKTEVGLLNVADHNSRRKIYKQGDRDPPEWIDNQYRAKLGQYDAGGVEILKRRKDRIEALNLKRRPQKNAACGIEFVVTASPEFWTIIDAQGRAMELPLEKQNAFFDEALAFLKQRYGEKNCLGAYIHRDEKTPHMHILFVPIVKNRYSSSEFLGGRTGLRDLQTCIYEVVGKKFGLSRGVEGSRRKHTDYKKWAANLNTKENELKQIKQEYAEAMKNFKAWNEAVNEIEREKVMKKTQEKINGMEREKRKYRLDF